MPVILMVGQFYYKVISHYVTLKLSNHCESIRNLTLAVKILSQTPWFLPLWVHDI